MSAGISRDEWMKALTEAGLHDQEDDQAAVTVTEFAAMFGIHRLRAARQLEALAKAGKAHKTYKRTRTPDGGRTFRYIAYRLQP